MHRLEQIALPEMLKDFGMLLAQRLDDRRHVTRGLHPTDADRKRIRPRHTTCHETEPDQRRGHQPPSHVRFRPYRCYSLPPRHLPWGAATLTERRATAERVECRA